MAGILDRMQKVGPSMWVLPAQKVELPDGNCFLHGRVRRAKAGELVVPFEHRFETPSRVSVFVNGNYDQQVGYIETVTRIEADHFVVTSYNADPHRSFVSWFAVGKLEGRG